MRGDYPAGGAGTDKPALQLAQDIERELRLLHTPTADLPLQCTTCHDRAGTPELYPCPTLRVARRLIRLRLAS